MFVARVAASYGFESSTVTSFAFNPGGSASEEDSHFEICATPPIRHGEPCRTTRTSCCGLLVGKYIKKGKPKGSKVHDTGRMLAQLAFWCDMREVLAADEATMGLEILGDIAEAILDESGKAKEALSGPVLILPEPSR
ncbi:hypothetical protein PF010_g20051 [Phytophthora fragariae]|uniref:Uncharacterized protein n=1 Tax=Phytophthora fragariae TaxID=53985 RepID=A0A6G0KFK8_9STRA|nr:hypothetical protein PF010_g20051 [Phytophthora fragariae]